MQAVRIQKACIQLMQKQALSEMPESDKGQVASGKESGAAAGRILSQCFYTAAQIKPAGSE